MVDVRLKRLHLALEIAFVQTLQNGIERCFEATEASPASVCFLRKSLRKWALGRVKLRRGREEMA